MDGLLDLWIHEIYNDDCVLGSDLGSVVYFVTIASDVQQIPGDVIHRHDRDECSRARQSRHDGFKHPRYGAAHLSSIVCRMFDASCSSAPPSAPLGRRFSV